MIGIDLRTLSHDECVNLASDIKKSLKFWKDPVMVKKLTRNLEIVENYISRTCEGPLSYAQRPLNINETRWV